jgi:hypothetical protein
MKQEHLGDGAYVTINRDFHGQVIFTANHHNEHEATDKVHMDIKALEIVRRLYAQDVEEMLCL